VFIPLENHDCENGGYSDVKLEKKQFMVSAISTFDSGAFVSLLNKGARIDILRVRLKHKVYKLYKMYRLTLNSRNITMILSDLFT
jgi:hypothetical protein